jgi:hypothetical protein
VALRGVRNSRTSSIGDLNARICEASDLRYPNQHQDKYRQNKGKFYKRLSFVSVQVTSKHGNPFLSLNQQLTSAA